MSGQGSSGAAPPVLLVMGVAGSGKSTLGAALAKALGWPFQEGDDLHPPVNIAKMAAGIALDDDDRWPWLDAVGAWIDSQTGEGAPGVITCSALKRAYRARLLAGRPRVRIVYVRAGRELVAARLAVRRGHYWPASLMESQFVALEAPGEDENPIIADADQATAAQVAAVLARGPFTQG